MTAILYNLTPPWLPMAKNNQRISTSSRKIKTDKSLAGTDIIVALTKGKYPTSSDSNDTFSTIVARKSIENLPAAKTLDWVNEKGTLVFPWLKDENKDPKKKFDKTVISKPNKSIINKVKEPLSFVENQKSIENKKTSDEGIIPFAWLDIFDDSLPEVLKTYCNADLLSDSDEKIHRLSIPEISDAVHASIEILLPDGSYYLTNRRNLNIYIDSAFLDILKNYLAEVGVNFAQSNLVFGAYKYRFNGIKYERLLVIVSKDSKLPQFSISNTNLEISFELASMLNGVEIMYRFADENGESHYYCLGNVKNGVADLNGEILIQLR